MADFTANLPESNTSGIRYNGDQSASVAANAFTDLAGSYLQKSANEDKLQKAANLNDFSRGIFDTVVSTNNQGYSAPKDVLSGVSDLNSTRKAEDAGRVPLGTLDIKLESFIQSKMAQYPDQAVDIMKYVKEQGYDHYLFRNIDQSKKIEDSQLDATNSARADAFKVAMSNGWVNQSDFNGGVLYGQKIQAQKNQFEASVAAAAEARTSTTFNDEQRTKLVSVAKTNATQALTQMIDTQAGPSIDGLIQTMSALEGRPDFETVTANLVPKINRSIEFFRSQALQAAGKAGLSGDDLKPIQDRLDTYQKMVQNLTTGPSSEFTMLKTGAETLQNKLSIDTATAYPLATKLKAIMGNGWTSLVPALPENVAKQLGLELQGAAKTGGLDTPQGQQALSDMIKATKGQLDLKTLSPDRAKVAIRGTLSALDWTTKNIVSKADTSSQTQQTWKGSYTTLLNAARGLTPNVSDADSLSTAANAIANQGSRTVIRNFLANSDGREIGEALALGSRAAAEQLLENVKLLPFGEFKPVYDAKAGVFKLNKTYNPGMTNPDPFSQDVKTPVDYEKAKKAVSTANVLLTHLVQTDDLDKELPQGATPLSRATFWATGDASDLKNQQGQPILKPGKPSEDAASVVIKKAEELSNRLRHIPFEVSALPSNIADAQIQQESGGKNGLVSLKGAVGVAQIRPQDFPQYDPVKLKNDPEYATKARDEIMQHLLEKHHGNASLALAEYHAGPDMAQWGPKTFKYVASILNKAGTE